jgi:cadmium resistance protein CadD (predicted permease)
MDPENTVTTVDVAPLVDNIEAYIPVLSVVGLAVLSVYVIIKSFKWIRSSM